MSMPDIQGGLVTTADDVAEFLAWIDECVRTRDPVAIDTETNGLHWWRPGFVRLIQFGTRNWGWAVPALWWGKVAEEAMRRLVVSHHPIIMHNSSFDLHAIRSMGWPVPAWGQLDDTVLLLHLRRSDLSKGLKSKQVADLVGNWIWQGRNLLDETKKRLRLNGETFWQHVPVEEFAYWGYAVMDTVSTRHLYDELLPIKQEFAPQYEREMRFRAIMHDAERRGIRVDANYTERLAKQMDDHIRRDRAELQIMGLDNPNSGDQLLALLEEDYGFVPEVFTDNGNPSLDKHVLSALAKAGGMQAELVELLLRYKRMVKWRSTYVQAFLSEADIHGYVHPSVNTVGARTGRLSIHGPPLQTLPGKQALIRACMLPARGERWWSIDWSNQEPRLLAHYGQGPALLDYFNQGDGTGSIHDFVAARLFGPGYTEAQRAVAKIFGLSRSYGAGASKMAAASGADLAFVESVLPEYDELMGLAGLNAYIAEMQAGRDDPYIVSLGGRRIYAEAGEEYKLTNYLMQGSGADVCKLAIVEMENAGLADSILVSVHDEVCLSLPKDEGPGLAEQVGKIMEGVADLAVKLPVDIDGPGKSWGALYEKEN